MTFPGPVPDQADVAVIGGGVIGVCTALFAARAGHRVVLLEKGRIAGEQSSRNWGWIRQQGRDPDELPIMVSSRKLWLELSQQTNVDIGFRQTGTTYFAPNDGYLQRYADQGHKGRFGDPDRPSGRTLGGCSRIGGDCCKRRGPDRRKLCG